MDVENLLISRVVADGKLGPAACITPDWFSDPASARVWTLILEHTSKYGKVPSVAAVKADYPTYKLVQSPEGLEYLTDRMVRNRSLALLERGITEAAQLHLDGDLDRVIARLHTALADVARMTPTDHDINLATNADERMEHYRQLAKLDGRLRGIPSGFPAIDNALSGFEAGQLITFVGPPKVGKSTSLLLMAKAANESGYSPLFVGFEMSNTEQFERLDSIRAGVSHTRLRNGTLTKTELAKLERAVNQAKLLPDFYLTQDTFSVLTVTGLRTKVESLKPDIVYIDGAYMMDDEYGEKKGSPQALTNITRALKRLAQQLQIPIVVTTQALESKMNGRVLTPYSVGYTSSFVQDSDAVFGAERTEDPHIVKIKLMLARNALPCEAYYSWYWDPPLFAELPYDPSGEEDGDDFGYLREEAFSFAS